MSGDIFFFFFLRPHLWHMEFPRLGVESELQLPSLHHSHSNAGSELHLRPTPQLTAMPDPSPPSEVRDQTHILMDTSQVCNPLSHKRHSFFFFFGRDIFVIFWGEEGMKGRGRCWPLDGRD